MLKDKEIQQTIDNLESAKMYIPDSEIQKIDAVIKLLMDLPELG